MFFYPYLCNIFRNLQDVQLLKQCKSMEELMKLTRQLGRRGLADIQNKPISQK